MNAPLQAFLKGFGVMFNTFGRLTLASIWLIFLLGAITSASGPAFLAFVQRLAYVPFALAFASLLGCVLIASVAAMNALRTRGPS